MNTITKLLLLTSLSMFAQQDPFKRIEDNFNKRAEAIENRFYELDFEEASKGVDISKVDLDPEKAKPNKYSSALSDRSKVVTEVNKYRGIKYLWGGSNPNAFDCSGLVQWTIKKTHGKTIPRTTATQYKSWGSQMKKNIRGAAPGDFVYFKTRGNNPVSHVGVYLGDDKFIHAPKSNDVVKVSEIKGYWKDKLVGYVELKTVLR